MVNTKSVTLYAGDRHFITTSNGSNVSFMSANPYVAKVNERTGEVTAMTIGSTIIYVYSDQGNAQVSVTVNGKYSTFVEPCLEFSKYKAQIIKICGIPDSETDTSLVYYHKNNEVHLADSYIFEDYKMSESVAVIDQDYAMEAMYFLSERYWSAGLQDGMYMFVNGYSKSDITMSVTLTKVPGYKLYYVIYMPYSSSTRCDIGNHIELDESFISEFAEYKE